MWMDDKFDAVLREALQMRSAGAETEDILAFLRSQGLFKIQSIQALRALEGITLAEAKKRVHLSRTWSDTRQADDRLHGAAERTLNEIGEPRLAASESNNRRS
jgi:ribosomal protein L7/L12